MNLETFAFLTQDGIATGAIYALLALALVMVFTVTRIIFVPQGEFVSYCVLTVAAFRQGHSPELVKVVVLASLLACGMEAVERIRHSNLRGLFSRFVMLAACPLAACVFAWYGTAATSQYWHQAVAAVLLVTSMGPVIYRVAFRPLADASPLVLLVAAIALHLVLVGIGLYVFGPEGSRLPAVSVSSPLLDSLSVAPQTVVVVGTTALLMILFFLFFGHTLSGRALRATAVSRSGAQLVGISPDASGELALTIAAFIGAVSGILIGQVTTIYYDSGFLLALKGFVGGIMGGLTGYVFAALGSVSVGLLEAFASYWASAAKEVIVFTLVVPLLIWRSLADPHGRDQE